MPRRRRLHNGRLEVTDAIAAIRHLFGGTGGLPPPGDCGLDPSEDGLGCASFAPCGE